MNRNDLITTYLATEELLTRKARSNFKQFVLYSKPGYSMTWFHSYICEKLQEFAAGKIKKMMILLPPQHGKTELSTRQFPPYLLGQNPDRKIAIISYASHIAENFNRSIQLNIDNPTYHKLFPKTKLNYSKLFGTNYDGKVRTTEKCEIVEYNGSFKTIGRGGALTSETVDIGIIDDLYKDRDEAISRTISENAWQWYVDVFLTRLHNDSQQLIMNTRWDEFDICGRLLSKEASEWEVIRFPAIREIDEALYDPRAVGDALWADKHSKEKILGIKILNEVTFNSLYQQDPKPNSEILVFKNWQQILKWPVESIGAVSWGLDFGKTTGTNALVKCAVIGKDAYIQECLYERGVPVSIINDALIANGYKEGEIVWCDHIPAKINDLRTTHRISAMPAIKGPGSVSAGIDKMNEYNVHYIGSNIKMETSKYQYVTYGNIITNEPVDDWNHALDASRYGLLSRYFRER